MVKLVFPLSLILALCLLSFADVIHLKNGNKLEGKVITETEEEITLKMDIGRMYIKRDLIDKIERKEVRDELVLSPKEMYRKRAGEIDDADCEGHFELGLYCVQKDLYYDAEKEFRKAAAACSEGKLNMKASWNLEAIKLFRTGIGKMNAKTYHEAIRCFETISEIYADTPVYSKASRMRQYCVNQLEKAKVASVKEKKKDKTSARLTVVETSKQLSQVLKRLPFPRILYYYHGSGSARGSLSECKVQLQYLKAKGRGYDKAVLFFIKSIESLERYYKAKKAKNKKRLYESAKKWYDKGLEAKEYMDLQLMKAGKL